MKKYKYDISVIIPCYNCEQYIEYSIKSILKQKYPKNKIELILINDGSTDNTYNIINEYKSDNVIIFNKENSGVSDTRNKGIELASGKYILFLDSDDYLSNNAIGDIVKFFDDNYKNVDIVTYPIIYVYPNGRKVKHKRYECSYENGTAIYDLNKYYYLIQPTVNVVIKNDKKHFFDANQFYSEDEKFNVDIIMKRKKIGLVNSAIYYYRRHNKSVTSNRAKIDLEHIYNYYEELQNKYNNDLFIQSVIINNFNWRIREKCLFVDVNSKDKLNYYLDKIKEKLKKINFEYFKNKIVDSEETLLELLALSEKNCTIKCNKLLCDDKVLIENIKSKNYITKIKKDKDSISIFGKIISPLFYNNGTKMIAKIKYRNSKEKKIRMYLYNSLNYQKSYMREYNLKINIQNIKEISFYIISKNVKEKVTSLPNEWCSSYKIYDNLQIKIRDNVIINNRKFSTFLFNKIYGCNSIKLLLLNFVSILIKGNKYKKVYFGDFNSEIYKKYMNDSCKNKKFYTSCKGNKYKLDILNCNELITDKDIDILIPFGRRKQQYIQSSNFKIIHYINGVEI